MKRNEAVTYLKELLTECNDMALNSVSFEEQKIGGTINYKLHIRGRIPEADKAVARDIAKKFSYQVADSEEGVTVFNATWTVWMSYRSRGTYRVQYRKRSFRFYVQEKRGIDRNVDNLPFNRTFQPNATNNK